MQNNLFIVISFIASQKRAVLISFFLLSFLILPSQASEEIKPQGSKANTSKFSKRKKIKKINDLRIIVDISGSMKKTDPKNLRRSAVRLLAGLVPEGSRAGIWNFGKEVNMSVKIGTVDDAWRKLARAESKKISSAGLYTNIESVMRKASFDWKKPDPKYKRNIIILTDGHVDISKDEKLNKASRKRILKEVLPNFEKAQVRIHTIALSDDVDEKLLSTLSAYTDGLYKKANNAEELQKIFLQMLEQSITLNTVPIKDNKFSVDASINDMTLLVFNKDKSRPTTIISPSGKRWESSSHPSKVKWFSDEGYDLITIKKPEKGEWKIQAPTDPNNRVVVATNLKLKINDIPSYLMLGDALNVTAHLEEDGKALTDTRLLSKFKFVLNRDAERSSERSYPLTKVEGDAFSYNVQFSAKFKEGNNELVIQAKSPTVEREIRHQFKVYTTPAEIEISENNGKYKIEVTPYQNIMRANSIKVSIELNDKSKHILVQQGKTWSVDVDMKYKESIFKVFIDAIGADGKPLSLSFDKKLSIEGGMKKLDLESKFKDQQMQEMTKEEPGITSESIHGTKDNSEQKHMEANDFQQASSQDEPAKHKISAEPGIASINNHGTKNNPEQKQMVANDPQQASSQEEPAKNEVSAGHEGDKETNTTFIISAIVIANLLIAGLVGGGYFYMKRRKDKLIASIGDELKDESSKQESSKENKS